MGAGSIDAPTSTCPPRDEARPRRRGEGDATNGDRDEKSRACVGGILESDDAQRGLPRSDSAISASGAARRRPRPAPEAGPTDRTRRRRRTRGRAKRRRRWMRRTMRCARRRRRRRRRRRERRKRRWYRWLRPTTACARPAVADAELAMLEAGILRRGAVGMRSDGRRRRRRRGMERGRTVFERGGGRKDGGRRMTSSTRSAR